MKKKLLTMTAMALMFGCVTSAMAGIKLIGTSTLPGDDPGLHSTPTVCDKTINNPLVTMWGDPGMWVATGLDLLATGTHKGRIIDAKKAIKQLKKALGEEEGGKGSGGGSPSTAEPSTATVFAPELILTQLFDGFFGINNSSFVRSCCQ